MGRKELEQELDSEILGLLKKIESQSKNDKISTLRNFVDKYMHLSTVDHMMDSHDLRSISSSAKQKFSNDNLNIFLGEKRVKVQPCDLANFCVIEATIRHLNGLGCLKRLPKFDKREDKY